MSNKIFAFTFLIGLLLAPLSHANLITYSYRGPDFNNPSPLPDPYQPGDHIEGFITIDDSLLDSSGSGNRDITCPGYTLPCEDPTTLSVGIIDWAFTDGVQTFSPDGPALGPYHIRLTFEAFEITQWDFVLFAIEPWINNGEYFGIASYCGLFLYSVCGGPEYGYGEDSADFGVDDASADIFVSAGYGPADVPATWERSLVAAPEPTTLALLSFGLAGLGFTRTKMKA